MNKLSISSSCSIFSQLIFGGMNQCVAGFSRTPISPSLSHRRVSYQHQVNMRSVPSLRCAPIDATDWWLENDTHTTKVYEHDPGNKNIEQSSHIFNELLSAPPFLLAEKIESVSDPKVLLHVFINTESFEPKIREKAFKKLFPKCSVVPLALSNRAIALKILKKDAFSKLCFKEHGFEMRSLKTTAGRQLFKLLKQDKGDNTNANLHFQAADFFNSKLYMTIKAYLLDQFPDKHVEIITQPICRRSNERGLGLHIDTGNAYESMKEIAETGSPGFLDFNVPYPLHTKNARDFQWAINHADKSKIKLFNAWFVIETHPRNKFSLAFLPKLKRQQLATVNANLPLPLFVGEGQTFDFLFPENKLYHMIAPENLPGEYSLIFETQGMVHASVDRDYNNLILMYESLNLPVPSFAQVKQQLWRQSLDVRFALWEPKKQDVPF